MLAPRVPGNVSSVPADHVGSRRPWGGSARTAGLPPSSRTPGLDGHQSWPLTGVVHGREPLATLLQDAVPEQVQAPRRLRTPPGMMSLSPAPTTPA